MKIDNLALNESIRNYDREDRRKNSLEFKASGFLAGDAIIITIWALLLNSSITYLKFPFNMIIVFYSSILILLGCVSSYYAFMALKVREYDCPLTNNPNEIKDILTRKSTKDDLFDKYVLCFSTNVKKNDEKTDLLMKSSNFLFVGMITAAGTIIFLIIFFILRG